MADTPNLGLTPLSVSQSGKYLTNNENFYIMDVMVQTTVIDKDLTAPPGSPNNGDVYIPAAGSTGDWAGHDNTLAYWFTDSGIWQFITPKEAWRVWVNDEGFFYTYSATVSPNVWVQDTNVITAPAQLNYTATGDDAFVLQFNIDAAGYADIKAIDNNYITGAMAAGETTSINLINIDECLATGGEVFAYSINSTSIGSVEPWALFPGVNVGVIHQHSGTFGNPDSFLVIAVDQLAAISIGGAGNITMFVADNDTITIGSSATFGEIEIIIDTPASGAGIVPTFEYSTGVGTWASFTPSDGTNGFRNTGEINWSVGDLAGFAVGTGSEYLIKITRTRNSLTTSPIVDVVQIAAINVYLWDKDANVNVNTLVAENIDAILGANTPFAINATTGDFSGAITVTTITGGVVAGYRNDVSVSSGNEFLSLESYGNDTTANAYLGMGKIVLAADGGHAAGDNPTKMEFYIVPDATETEALAIKIDNQKKLFAYGDVTLESETAPVLELRSTKTAVGAAEVIGSFQVYGSDTSSGGADVRTSIETVSDSASGLAYNLVFKTSLNNAAPVVGMTLNSSQNLAIVGALSKGSGSFRIPHVLPELKDTHELVHSFVEAPIASNLYAGMAVLVNGLATVNIDEFSNMTEGTFEALNHLSAWSSSNESGYSDVKCSMSGNILTIECEDLSSTDTVYWEVRGERKDPHMIKTSWTDDKGRVIVEPFQDADEGIVITKYGIGSTEHVEYLDLIQLVDERDYPETIEKTRKVAIKKDVNGKRIITMKDEKYDVPVLEKILHWNKDGSPFMVEIEPAKEALPELKSKKDGRIIQQAKPAIPAVMEQSFDIEPKMIKGKKVHKKLIAKLNKLIKS